MRERGIKMQEIVCRSFRDTIEKNAFGMKKQ